VPELPKVSWSWLQDYVHQLLIPQGEVSVKSPGRLTIECDELWSFVNSKENDVYIWLAIDLNNSKMLVVLWR